MKGSRSSNVVRWIVGIALLSLGGALCSSGVSWILGLIVGTIGCTIMPLY
jgi:hypothetical protein